MASLALRLGTLVVLVCVSIGQISAQCTDGQEYSCIDRTSYLLCRLNTAQSCTVVYNSTYACYPGRNKIASACLVGKDNCTSAGSFALDKTFAKENNLCGTYYTCASDGKGGFSNAKFLLCPVNYEFSATKKECVATSEAGCSVELPTTSAPTTTTFGPCKSGDIAPDHTDCHWYYLCDAYATMQRRLCGFGWFYDIVNKKCVTSKDVCSNGARPA